MISEIKDNSILFIRVSAKIKKNLINNSALAFIYLEIQDQNSLIRREIGISNTVTLNEHMSWQPVFELNFQHLSSQVLKIILYKFLENEFQFLCSGQIRLQDLVKSSDSLIKAKDFHDSQIGVFTLRCEDDEAKFLAPSNKNPPAAIQEFLDKKEEEFKSPLPAGPEPANSSNKKTPAADSSSQNLQTTNKLLLSSNSDPAPKNKPKGKISAAAKDKNNYFQILQNYRLTMSESPEVFEDFKLGEVTGGTFARRINTEMKTIRTTVPCDSAASIFTVIDSQCMHRLKFMISGTLDTPYAHGLYLFDMLLPDNYPLVPPSVVIRTTGDGKIRFNPNLYSNGYVCLSIINTWNGRPEEMWNPATSSIVQVLISIQSLVMDCNIIQKEPGFANLPTNSNENLGYQIEVKYGNLKYAIVENIKNPPAGFRDVIFNHFKCKKQEILATAQRWTEELKNVREVSSSSQNLNINAEINKLGPYKAFSDIYKELNSLLSRL